MALLAGAGDGLHTVRAIDGPLWRQERIRTRVLGKNVKNWTVRQRILASFAVIIAIMLLMAATAYVKMLTVEKGAYRVQDDAMPGMYFITLVRSSWTDNYLQTQELFRRHRRPRAEQGRG